MASFIADEVNFDEDQSTQFIPKLMERAYKLSVSTSATELGQFGLKQLDKILWVSEKTAKWSCRESYESNKPKCKPATLVRPLPWLLFLPALLLLRCGRTTFSLLSQLAGYEPIGPNDVVAYSQMCRRKLRALKYQGLRLIRIRTDEKHLNKDHDAGIVQAFFVSIARALSCQTPDVFEHMRELLVHEKKNSKCSLNQSRSSKKKSESKKRVHREIDDMDSDSSGDSQRLKEFLEKSFSDETDSDDEDFRLNTSDDIKDNDLSESSISEQDTEKELQNGPKGDSSPEKDRENGEAETKTPYSSATKTDVPITNNGVEADESEKAAENADAKSEEKSGHSTDTNSSITADSKSPGAEDKSRDSSKENLSVPASSGPRVRSHRQSNYNRSRIYRNLKKNNGENQRQPEDPTNNAQSTNSNKFSHSNYHAAKATKRPQI